MSTRRLVLSLTALMVLSGCADMMTVTPQLEMKSGSAQKMEVKAKVMVVGLVSYSPDGRQLASGGATPTVRVWDTVNAKVLRALTIPAGKYGLADIAYSPDGKRLAASTRTSMLGGDLTHIWDTNSGTLVKVAPGNFGNKLAFSKDGLYLLGSELDFGGLFSDIKYNAKQMAVHGGEIVRSYPGVAVGDLSPDGRSALLTTNPGSGMVLVDLQTGGELWRNRERHVDAVAFTPDRKHFLGSRAEFHGLTGSRATISVGLFDAATGNPIRDLSRYDVENTLMGHEKDFAKISVIEVAPDGAQFLTGNQRGEYKLWNLASGQLIRQLKRPDEKMLLDMSPAHAAFSPNGKLVAVTFAGAVRVHNVADGEEVATLISFDDGEWLVTTPSGYYNASEKGDQYLNVSVGGAPFTIGQLRESFYRPDLVKVALAGGTLSDFKKIADIKPPPAVAIVDTPNATASPKIAVTLRVKDQGGGVGDVRLYRNGAAVVFEKTRNLNVAAAEQGSQVLRYDVSLEPGNNTIRAIAFNADNSMQSTDTSINIQASIATRQPALHAIVIGIKDFANPRLALKYPVADGELFASTLETRGKSLFSSVNVKRMFKPAETTNAAIIAALKQARNEVGPEDLFVFYVASHGTVDDGQYLLITSNVGSTTTARLKQDALTQDALKELISNIPASKKLVVLDTCSAGQLGDAIQVAMLTRGMSDDTAMKVLSRAVGSTVLSAATSVQEALEGYKGHGLFTYVIVEGLKGAADTDKDGFVKTLELADYVDNQVPELAEKVFQHKQYPIVSPTGQGFPLVRVR
jgi:WD40 repeat protein